MGLLNKDELKAGGFSGALLDYGIAPLSTIVPVDGSGTNNAATLEAALENARLAGYQIVGRPTDIVSMERPITHDARCEYAMNGAVFDFSSIDSTSGYAWTCKGMLTPSGTERVSVQSGVTLKSSRNTSAQLNGLRVLGTSDAQVQNVKFADWNIRGFVDNVAVGDYTYILTWENCWNHRSVRRGYSFDFPTSPGASGENYRIIGGNCSNHNNGMTNAAYGVYVDLGAVNDLYVCGLSTDFSDVQLRHVSGNVTWVAGHFEATYDRPFIEMIGNNGTTNGANGGPSLHLVNPLFYQPLSAQPNETVGGRPTLISMNGFRCSLKGSARWTTRPADAAGAVNSEFVTYVGSGSPQVNLNVTEMERAKRTNKMGRLGVHASNATINFEDDFKSVQGPTTDYVIDSTNQRSGTKCLAISLSGAATRTDLYREFDLPPGRKIRAVGWFSSSNGSTGTYGLRVDQLDVNGNTLASAAVAQGGAYLTASTTWSQHGDFVDRVPSATKVRVYIAIIGFTGTARVDDIEIALV